MPKKGVGRRPLKRYSARRLRRNCPILDWTSCACGTDSYGVSFKKSSTVHVLSKTLLVSIEFEVLFNVYLLLSLVSRSARIEKHRQCWPNPGCICIGHLYNIVAHRLIFIVACFAGWIDGIFIIIRHTLELDEVVELDSANGPALRHHVHTYMISGNTRDVDVGNNFKLGPNILQIYPIVSCVR